MKRELEERLDEEIRFHVEQQIEKNRRAGMTPEEARRQALIRFGGVEQVRERTRDEFRAGLDRVADGMKRYRVCLMCAEREPLDCHRCLLVARALAERAFAIGHVLADARVEPHAQTEERLLELARTSADLLADRDQRLAAAYARRAGAAGYRRVEKPLTAGGKAAT